MGLAGLSHGLLGRRSHCLRHRGVEAKLTELGRTSR
jgi:hypothetical protein